MSETKGVYVSASPVRVTVKVARLSKRLAVRIPPELQALGWEPGRTLFVGVFDGSLRADAYDFEGAEEGTLYQVNNSVYWPISDDQAEAVGMEHGNTARLSGTAGRLSLDEAGGIAVGMSDLYDSWLSVQSKEGKTKSQALQVLSSLSGESIGRMTLSRWKGGRRPQPEIINRMVSDVLNEIVSDGSTIDKSNVDLVIEALHFCETKKGG